MLNTSAPLFKDENYKVEIERQQAELYSRLYPFAAEDFVNHPDLQAYIKLNLECLNGMQTQLTELYQILSSHTHNIPPHTHAIVPHTHICPSGGGPSSPNTTGMVTQPQALRSDRPIEAASIKWNTITVPIFKNTSGALENLEGNKVIQGPSKVGPTAIYSRRMKTPELLNTTVSIPPLLKLGY